MVGGLAHVGLVAFTRISEQRTLAKLNAFDLVVAAALGSPLSGDPLAGTGCLAGRPHRLRRSDRAAGRPVPAFGAVPARVNKDEAPGAVRAAGAAEIGQADYVFLESDGSISMGLREA